MKTSRRDVESTEIASNFTVSQYQHAVAARDRDAIAAAIRRRFTERYIAPVTTAPRHGFAIMAISCLMLEALESFIRGWKRSTRQSEKLFVEFLDRETDFVAFRGKGIEFYANVRCGILHQVETTAGWRLLRSGELFDGHRTINAIKFIQALQRVLNRYCDELKQAGWETNAGTQPGVSLATSATTASAETTSSSLVVRMHSSAAPQQSGDRWARCSD